MDCLMEASREGIPAFVEASWDLAWATSRALVSPRRQRSSVSFTVCCWVSAFCRVIASWAWLLRSVT